MISIRNNILTSIVLLLTFLGVAHTTFASEVSGTLSSDGKAKTQEEVILGDSPGNAEVVGQGSGENNGQIQGSVIGGREENTAAVALTDSSLWNTVAWTTLFAMVILIALSYFFLRRGKTA